jgi:hypothetical protein
MIRIIYDSENLISLSGEKTVSKIAEYAEAYAHVLDAIQNHQELRLVVHQQPVFRWLNSLSLRYTQGNFVFVIFDARKALEDRWQTALPADLTNEEIKDTCLLDLDLQAPQPGQSFTDILLAHFYIPLLSAKTFPFTKATQLLNAVDLESWQANQTNPLLARILNQRLEAWQGNARSSEQRQFIALFAANPGQLKQQFTQFRVLRHYPALGETLLDDLYPLFAALKLPLQDLEVDEQTIPDAVLQVTYHLNAHKPTSAEEMQAFVEKVSGLLWVEFETIERHLLDNTEWVSSTLLDQIENKFEELAHRTSRRLKTLRAMIRPPKPGAPEVDWDVHQILTWATNSYLPYQAWCSAQEQFDPELYAIGDQFSEWLVGHWNDLHANSKRMVFNILPNIAVELSNQEIVNLVLVVDNLGWSLAEILIELFHSEGYFLTAAEPYLAMLPTETEISKKCLLAGEVGYSKINDTTYKGMIEKGWVPFFNNNAFRYISDIGKLKQIINIDASAYMVNYLAVDRALHKSEDEIGIPHREHVHHLLKKLVENVITFIEKHALQEKIRIHVVSDHGSTQIPDGLQNDLDPDFFKGSGCITRSHRYLEVSDEKFAGLADNLKVDCFFLPKQDYLLTTNVLCARRANRFISTDQKSFVHGGLLPEEVIVPYLAFEPATVPLQDLTVLLKKNAFRYRLETIELEVGNPNEVIVEQIQVSVLNSNVESEPVLTPILTKKSKASIKIPVRFKLTSLIEEQTNLRLRVRYHCRGEKHIQDVQPTIVMRKMVEEKSTGIFDELE